MAKNLKNYVLKLALTCALAASLMGFLFKGWDLRAIVNGIVHVAAAFAVLYNSERFTLPTCELTKKNLDTVTCVALAAGIGTHYVLDSIVTTAAHAALSQVPFPDPVLRITAFLCVAGILALAVRLFHQASSLEAKLKKYCMAGGE